MISSCLAACRPRLTAPRISCVSESSERALHPRPVDDGGPPFDLRSHFFAELVGQEKLRFDTLDAQALPRVGRIDGLPQKVVDARDQSGRRGSGREQTEPQI